MVNYIAKQKYLITHKNEKNSSQIGMYDLQDLIAMDNNFECITTFPSDIVKETGEINSIEQIRDFVDEEGDETYRELNNFLIELYNSGEIGLMSAISKAFKNNLDNYGRVTKQNNNYEADFSDRGPVLQGIAYILHKEDLAKAFMALVENGGEADFKGITSKDRTYGMEYFYKLNQLRLVDIDTERKKWKIRKFGSFREFNITIWNLIAYSNKFKSNPLLKMMHKTLKDYLRSE